ncbi:NF038215 family lipoprotein [Acinetobacter sp. MD2(2019)]|nr:NF038215 family lipoprotein [Acinetobacter sp. MD2(2019)]MEB3754840.1 hypothetical protein [Acinetobacter sp. MD2(2019)]
MKKIAFFMLCLVVLAGCEAVEKKPKYDTKSIAGMPVHEQDYQLKTAKN